LSSWCDYLQGQGAKARDNVDAAASSGGMTSHRWHREDVWLDRGRYQYVAQGPRSSGSRHGGADAPSSGMNGQKVAPCGGY
jgi:hypothetical protein